MKISKIVTVVLIACLLLLSIFFLLSIRKKRTPPSKPEWVILIIVDTLRADRLGCYGYQTSGTENIDALADTAALFLQAISPCPETGPAVSSILTSLYPHNHGVRANMNLLPAKVITLAEILKKNGFKTSAFVDTYPMRKLRILQGFDYIQKRRHALSSTEEAIESAVREPLTWIEKNKEEKIFTLIHFYDPHMPYRPAKLSQTTLSLNYDGRYEGHYGPALLLWTKDWTINEKDLAYMSSLYDDEIRFVDNYMGRLTLELKKMGAENKTLLVFTADHGEALGEHDYYFDHGDCLYEHQTRVPLIIDYPQMPKRGLVIDTQVRTIDIMPTILHILEVEHQGHQDGVSLVPLLWGKKDVLGTRYAFSESDFIQLNSYNNRGYTQGIKGKHLSVRTDGMKFIYVPQRPGGEFELYDLTQDPEEIINIVKDSPEIAREMSKVLFDWLSNQKQWDTKEEPLDEEARKILESLHYIRK